MTIVRTGANSSTAAAEEFTGVIHPMEPLTFTPILKRIRWGGSRLGTLLKKPVGTESDYAESWEIADHADGQSYVCSGDYSGMALTELISQQPEELFGRHAGVSQFPLLMKFLDANDWLSLQVHPDDVLARQFNARENGKTEAWVIIDAAQDSRICAGLKPGVDARQLRRAVESGHVESCLHIYPVKPGDCIYVPAGTVHALGPGIVLAEIQQQSNLTFRLHDWGRVGADGKPRPLHLDESLACTDFNRGPVDPVKPVQLAGTTHVFEELVRCPYFVIRRHQSANPFAVRCDNRFRVVMVLEGKGVLQTTRTELLLNPGQTVLLPASCASVEILPETPITVLEVLQP
ncbi:MAG: class I mannose-6-phosphate isomerase [Planctomycetaceae bacterium]|nr:class I mannose-6-phosphate isomerase [Planctomycetaceae bacterium]